MEMPRLVGLAGMREVGKSTLASHLRETYGYTRISLAGPLKRAVELAYNVTPGYLDSSIFKRAPVDWLLSSDALPDILAEHFALQAHTIKLQIDFVRHTRGDRLSTPREALQIIGTDVLRAIEESVHIFAASRRWQEVLDSGGKVVCDDIRYRNELHILELAGGMPVFIHRTNFDPPPAETLHISDRGLRERDFRHHFLIRGSKTETAIDFDRFLVSRA